MFYKTEFPFLTRISLVHLQYFNIFYHFVFPTSSAILLIVKSLHFTQNIHHIFFKKRKKVNYESGPSV